MTEPYDTSTHAELGLMQGYPPPSDKRVDAINGLWVPPFNRWAYQNMRQLIPSQRIAPAPVAVHLPRRTDGGIDRLVVQREDGTEAGFDTFLRQTFTDSFVVVADGAVVYERYLNGMTADQPHQMMSCTKSFIGLFALMAVEHGHLSEDDLVGERLPELDNGGAFADATVGQVLDMTSSMAFNEDYADPAAHIHDYASLVGLGPGVDDRPVPADNLHDYLTTLTKESGLAHGEVVHYQTPKTDVVNWVNNRLTGLGLVDQLEAELWRPLGCDGEAYVLLDSAGTPLAGGGLNATPNDLARFATMIVGNGEFDGREVVSKAVIDKIGVGGSTEALLAGPDASGVLLDGHWSYRAKWWVRRTPGREAMMAIGVNGQWIYCDRDRGVAIVKQSSQPVAVDPYFDDYTVNAFDAVIRYLTSR